MPTYAFRDERGDVVATAPEFAKPIPVHAQTPGARAAVEAVRRHGHAQRLTADAGRIVAEHGRPHADPYPGDTVTRGARALLDLAESKGWRVNLVELADRCAVEGVRGGEAFRAVWVRGRAYAGTWHSARYRYAMVDDERPIAAQDARAKTSKAGGRPIGMSREHLTIVASPMGIPIGVTAVVQKVRQS